MERALIDFRLCLSSFQIFCVKTHGAASGSAAMQSQRVQADLCPGAYAVTDSGTVALEGGDDGNARS